MGEPLKNSFGPDVIDRIGADIAAVAPDFDAPRFRRRASRGLDRLELTDRARHIVEALAAELPADRRAALRTLVRSLGPELPDARLAGMDGFVYLPHVLFVAQHGLDHFEEAMGAQYELTKRFTAEFSIRAFLERYPEKTLDRLRRWSSDPNVHVRRLVSEGTRPRLPWAPRLRAFQRDPAPVIGLLDLLCRDPELYVRRSVANNLNDISKDHPGRATAVASRWCDQGVDSYVIRHGLRTLVKAGDPEALALLGYSPDSPAHVELRLTPRRAAIGGTIGAEVALHNPTADAQQVLVDLRVHFVRPGGRSSPKVFKVGEFTLQPGESRMARKTISVAQQSTRTHHPGRHTVDLMVNGQTRPGADFVLE